MPRLLRVEDKAILLDKILKKDLIRHNVARAKWLMGPQYTLDGVGMILAICAVI